VWRGDLFEDRLEEAIGDVSDILYGCTRLLGGRRKKSRGENERTVDVLYEHIFGIII